jgi:hypothetical protein
LNSFSEESASLVVDFDEYDDWHAWKVSADDGLVRNHDPEGDTLTGIEVMVRLENRGLKLARRLYDARKTPRDVERILIEMILVCPTVRSE